MSTPLLISLSAIRNDPDVVDVVPPGEDGLRAYVFGDTQAGGRLDLQDRVVEFPEARSHENDPEQV